MQPLAPATFPKRVKRFQSYSMTPLDSELDLTNSLLCSTVTGSNKFNFQSTKRKAEIQPSFIGSNPDTNQISTTIKTKLFGSDRINVKHLQKSQLQNGNQQLNYTEKASYISDLKKHRKMITSDIFLFSSMVDKNSFSDQTNNHNILSKISNEERKSFDSQIIEKQLTRTDKKEREVRVPSFLLNKKKQMTNSTIANNGAMTERDMKESTPTFEQQGSPTQNRISFKKPSIQLVSKKFENQNSQPEFQPPSDNKIGFSKATASTLYTNFPREESRRTFRDFDQIMEQKEIQNSMEESDNSNNLHNEVNNLFGKQEQPERTTGMLATEIAELFSDEDLDSEEFNQELKHELDDLF